MCNAKDPVPGKPEVKDKNGKVTKAAVAPVPGEAKAFEVIVNKTAVRIASDSVTVNGRKVSFPFQPNRSWCNGAIRIDGGKMTVYASIDRKLAKQVEIPFAEAVTGVNFNALPENAFSITNISITSGGKLIDNPVEKHFADFRSLSQPLPAGAVKTNVTLVPNVKGYAGARIKLNKVDTPLEMTLVWSNGAKTVIPITAGKFNVGDTRLGSVAATVGQYRKGQGGVELDDGVINFGGQRITQCVRSLHRMTSTYDCVPQYIDILRDWNKLPSASQHPLDLDFVAYPDNKVDMFVDASLAKTFSMPEAPVKGKVAPGTPLAKLTKIEFKGNGVSEVLVKKDKYAGYPAKYYFIDLAGNPRAKAFADAKSSLKEGVHMINNVPYDVAKPLDSGDIAICKQGKGNWAMEVEEYLARSPLDGLPSAVHFRIPSAPYSVAHLIVAIDPDPAKDKILTVRISRYEGVGIGGNMIGDAVLDLSDGKIPANFKQVGTLMKNGKTIPLYQVDVQMNLGAVIDLAARNGDYLDFDFIGKTGENTEQLDNRMKPDIHSDSAFNIFAVTLEKSPVMMDFKQASPGNVFTADEKALTTVTLKATRDNSNGRILWVAKDVDGKTVFHGEKSFSLKKQGDTAEIEIPLKAEIGYYDLDVTLACDGCAPLTHPARFAILPKDNRKWSNTASPYATWWFTAHGSPGAMEMGGPLMMKAGIRKSCNAPTEEAMKKYNINYNGNLYVGASQRDIDMATGHFKDVTVMVPDPQNPKKKIKKTISGEEAFVNKVKSAMKPYLHYDHIMIWHESGPGYGIPEELLNMPLSKEALKMKEDDKRLAMYINESGRIIRKHFPGLRIQIGNSSAAIGSAVRPLRAGADPQYYDRMGIEIPSQLVMPEKLQECGFQGMMVTKDIATKLAKRPVKADGCWEFIYRPARDLGEQQQAEWHMRDVLISLANDFNLISIGLLFDCTNGYYNHFYGGSGIICRAPYVYPKRSYVAYAALTSALDTVKFERQLDTGSTTVYALEFKKADGTYAYAFWCARGAFELTLDNSANTGFLQLGNPGAVLTEFYGKTHTLKGEKLQIKCGTAPVYLCTKKPIKFVAITERSFPEEAARAAKAKLGSPFDDVALVTMAPDPMITTNHTDFLPINKPGSFTMANVNDPDKGKAISVTLDLSKDPYKSNYIVEYTTLTLKKPMPVAGNPKAVGIWIKGNSSWGQVRFEIEDAQGEIFKGITTDGWGCDVYDWPGNTCLNFDGWCYVAQPLFPSSLFCNHSPGPASEQWISCGGDKKIDLPVKVRAVSIGMYRNTLDLLDFKKAKPTVLLKDFGGVEE